MKKCFHIMVRIALVIWMIIMAVLLGMIGYRYNNMSVALERISNQLTYLEDTSRVIGANVNHLEEQLAAGLQDDSSLIEDYSVRVTSCNFAKGTYEALVTVVPKEYTDITQASVYFGTNEYPLVLNGYAYQGTASLPIDTPYDGNMTVLFTDGTKKTTEVLHEYAGFQSKAAEVLNGNMIAMPEYADGMLSVSDEVTVALDGNGMFEFTSLCYVIFADDEIIFADDLLDGRETPHSLAHDDEDANETGESAADGGESPLTWEVLMEEYAHVPTRKVDATYPAKAQQKAAHGARVRVLLTAWTKEGYRFEYDLFNGILSAEEDFFLESADYFAPHLTMYDDKGGEWRIK